jgi:hypothetical protein
MPTWDEFRRTIVLQSDDRRDLTPGGLGVPRFFGGGGNFAGLLARVGP